MSVDSRVSHVLMTLFLLTNKYYIAFNQLMSFIHLYVQDLHKLLFADIPRAGFVVNISSKMKLYRVYYFRLSKTYLLRKINNTLNNHLVLK